MAFLVTDEAFIVYGPFFFFLNPIDTQQLRRRCVSIQMANICPPTARLIYSRGAVSVGGALRRVNSSNVSLQWSTNPRNLSEEKRFSLH